jgi:hypothetical protein
MRKFTRELLLPVLELESLEMDQVAIIGKYEVKLFFFQVRIVLQGNIPEGVISFASSELNRGYLGSRHFCDLTVLDEGFNLDTH